MASRLEAASEARNAHLGRQNEILAKTQLAMELQCKLLAQMAASMDALERRSRPDAPEPPSLERGASPESAASPASSPERQIVHHSPRRDTLLTGPAATPDAGRASGRASDDEDNDDEPDEPRGGTVKKRPLATQEEEEDDSPRPRRSKRGTQDDDDDVAPRPPQIKQRGKQRTSLALVEEEAGDAEAMDDDDAPEASAAPARRWGHSAVAMNGGRELVVLGGEVDDGAGADRGAFVYDTATRAWRAVRCAGDDGAASRAWHGACVVEDDAAAEHVVVFGGSDLRRPPRNSDAAARLDELRSDAFALDVSAARWAPLVVGRPPARVGACCVPLLDGSRRWAAIGGVTKDGRPKSPVFEAYAAHGGDAKRSRGQDRVEGKAPSPVCFHTATVLAGGSVVVFGGRGADGKCNKSVTVLCQGAGNSWEWDRPFVVGDAPSARMRHAACVLVDGTSILIHGGQSDDMAPATWPFAAAAPAARRSRKCLSDAFILDTKLWEWKPAPLRLQEALGHRAGHTLTLLCDPSRPAARHVAVFGGRDGAGGLVANLDLLPSSLLPDVKLPDVRLSFDDRGDDDDEDGGPPSDSICY